MHPGEETFRFSWPEYLILGTFLCTYLLLVFTNKLPSMVAFKEFADTINSAGGHIILLSLFTLYSIKITMQLFYHVLGLPGDLIPKQEALINMVMNFATGVLCGTFIGALIKTMSGGQANAKPPLTVVETPGGTTKVSAGAMTVTAQTPPEPSKP